MIFVQYLEKIDNTFVFEYEPLNNFNFNEIANYGIFIADLFDNMESKRGGSIDPRLGTFSSPHTNKLMEID